MSYRDPMASLELISEDIHSVLNQAMAQIEAFHNSNHTGSELEDAAVELHKLRNIFALLDMKGAHQLIKDILASINQLYAEGVSDSMMEAMGYSLSMIGRYVDFMCHKPFDLPELLFPALNEFRKECDLPLFKESSFFKADHHKMRETVKETRLERYDAAEKSRLFRQMYQIGLIEVIRRTNVPGGLNMMGRALKRLDEQCGCSNSPNLFWIAIGVIEGYVNGGLIINRERIKLFSKLDLQIRELAKVSDELNYQNRESADALTQELLYLVSLSESEDMTTQQLKSHFELNDVSISDRVIHQEYLLLKGPSYKDFEALFDTLLDDVTKIHAHLSAYQAGSRSTESLIPIKEHLEQLYKLLSVLKMSEEADAIKPLVDTAEQLLRSNDEMTEEQRLYMQTALKTIEQALKAKSRAPLKGDEAVTKSALPTEHIAHCKNAKKSLHQACQTLEDFIAYHNNVAFIKLTPELLKQAAESLSKLNDGGYSKIVLECAQVVEDFLLIYPESIHKDALQLMADILCSVEFYLESAEKGHRPNPQILDFALESMAKLDLYIKKASKILAKQAV
ncbi:hypothetical protein [Pleionea sp. CnH1-48]|uniref:hypothetical protein n=1 Tax=Pleionea sp. CnH1-48 TaxID=2954494 RepID=UPI0020985403|nr:hypothetical protein [Pleionea sp. CnH1-48]MCO7225111.1 hypothetical protein [Pleionea sp. CnH1-48]